MEYEYLQRYLIPNYSGLPTNYGFQFQGNQLMYQDGQADNNAFYELPLLALQPELPSPVNVSFYRGLKSDNGKDHHQIFH